MTTNQDPTLAERLRLAMQGEMCDDGTLTEHGTLLRAAADALGATPPPTTEAGAVERAREMARVEGAWVKTFLAVAPPTVAFDPLAPGPMLDALIAAARAERT